MQCLEKRVQFVHIDDVARLIAHLLRRSAHRKKEPTVLNVAGRGDPVTLEQAAHVLDATIANVRYRWRMRRILQRRWKQGLTVTPPEALPFLIGSCGVDTTRLKQFLGKDYETVIQHTVTATLKESLHGELESVLTDVARHN
jgi:nucleoside-diphosphate-sugar epimerase